MPLFARKGAVIPLLKPKADRANIKGMLLNGAYNQDLIIRIYPSATRTCFTLHEDDGVSTDYKNGKVAQTIICQQLNGKVLDVSISAVKGSFKGLLAFRNYELEVFSPLAAKSISFNGQGLRDHKLEKNLVKVVLGERAQNVEKKIQLQF